MRSNSMFQRYEKYFTHGSPVHLLCERFPIEIAACIIDLTYLPCSPHSVVCQAIVFSPQNPASCSADCAYRNGY